MESITKPSVVEKLLKTNKIKTTEHLEGDDERPENAKKDVYTLLSVY